MKEIIKEAEAWAEKETPDAIKPLFNIANKAGQILAEKLNANKDLVMLGTLLMDIKLGECKKEGKRSEHVERSSQAAQEFLNKFDLNQETKDKIINCVEAHHAKIPFTCKEAEITANADCYKFLHPKGILIYFKVLSNELSQLNEVIKQVEAKMEEKWSVLSLDICKEELELYYQQFKELFSKAKEA